MKHVIMADVAQKAGVSLKTVSRVINSEKNISPAVREKVTQVIKELGYVPHAAARRLSNGRAMTVGMVLSYIQPVTDQYTGLLIERVLEECNKRNYHLLLILPGMISPENLIDMYLGQYIDGLFIDQIASGNPEIVHRLESSKVPYVIIHPDEPNLQGMSSASIVCIADRKGAREATRHLIELGHRNIGFVSDPEELFTEKERLCGYQEALIEAGIPFRPELVYQGSRIIDEPVGSRYRYGYEGASKLLSDNNNITAIFALTDFEAIGVFHAVLQLGLKIPDDISVVGFDDIPLVSHIFPSLTTVHQPIDMIAAKAVEFLLERINHPETQPQKITLETNLVNRESCKRIA
jgi:LacI family transcriptional regulator